MSCGGLFPLCKEDLPGSQHRTLMPVISKKKKKKKSCPSHSANPMQSIFYILPIKISYEYA
jgi:hypothetical protein